MSKSSKPVQPSVTPAADTSSNTNTDTAPAPFSSRESMRLLRISRFLVKIADPSLARSRARVAYSTNDHLEGWRLYRVAAGEGQPLDVTPPDAPTGGANVGILQHLDDFENKWFPRTRRIIERFAPASHRESLLEAFFRDLQQQPLGPLVVGSVGTFLDRVEALAKSDVPGAAKVRSVLAERGLDEAHVARLRQTLGEARTLKNAPAAPVIDPAVALRARREAYEACLSGCHPSGSVGKRRRMCASRPGHRAASEHGGGVSARQTPRSAGERSAAPRAAPATPAAAPHAGGHPAAPRGPVRAPRRLGAPALTD